MISEPRPLWKLLLQTAVPEDDIPLTCADCFAILEYLADVDIIGADRAKLLHSARQHLNSCPDCHDYYLRRLSELESAAHYIV